jgi:hypothetical protein
MSRRDATLSACQLRLRPILMTSFAFILGVVPLLLGHGAGSEMRRVLGVAVFSGMLGVTLFGIFLTPVFFYIIAGFADQHPFAWVRKLLPRGLRSVTVAKPQPAFSTNGVHATNGEAHHRKRVISH